MAFLSRILEIVQGFLESLFASSSPEYKKKSQLRAMAQDLRRMEPPVYQHNGGMLLPSFASALFQIYQFLEPIRTLLSETIANQDRRAALRFRDWFLELAVTPEQRTALDSLAFSARTQEMIAGQQTPEQIIEEQERRFSLFYTVSRYARY